MDNIDIVKSDLEEEIEEIEEKVIRNPNAKSIISKRKLEKEIDGGMYGKKYDESFIDSLFEKNTIFYNNQIITMYIYAKEHSFEYKGDNWKEKLNNNLVNVCKQNDIPYYLNIKEDDSAIMNGKKKIERIEKIKEFLTNPTMISQKTKVRKGDKTKVLIEEEIPEDFINFEIIYNDEQILLDRTMNYEVFYPKTKKQYYIDNENFIGIYEVYKSPIDITYYIFNDPFIYSNTFYATFYPYLRSKAHDKKDVNSYNPFRDKIRILEDINIIMYTNNNTISICEQKYFDFIDTEYNDKKLTKYIKDMTYIKNLDVFNKETTNLCRLFYPHFFINDEYVEKKNELEESKDDYIRKINDEEYPYFLVFDLYDHNENRLLNLEDMKNEIIPKIINIYKIKKLIKKENREIVKDNTILNRCIELISKSTISRILNINCEQILYKKITDIDKILKNVPQKKLLSKNSDKDLYLNGFEDKDSVSLDLNSGSELDLNSGSELDEDSTSLDLNSEPELNVINNSEKETISYDKDIINIDKELNNPYVNLNKDIKSTLYNLHKGYKGNKFEEFDIYVEMSDYLSEFKDIDNNFKNIICKNLSKINIIDNLMYIEKDIYEMIFIIKRPNSKNIIEYKYIPINNYIFQRIKDKNSKNKKINLDLYVNISNIPYNINKYLNNKIISNSKEFINFSYIFSEDYFNTLNLKCIKNDNKFTFMLMVISRFLYFTNNWNYKSSFMKRLLNGYYKIENLINLTNYEFCEEIYKDNDEKLFNFIHYQINLVYENLVYACRELLNYSEFSTNEPNKILYPKKVISINIPYNVSSSKISKKELFSYLISEKEDSYEDIIIIMDKSISIRSLLDKKDIEKFKDVKSIEIINNYINNISDKKYNDFQQKYIIGNKVDDIVYDNLPDRIINKSDKTYTNIIISNFIEFINDLNKKMKNVDIKLDIMKHIHTEETKDTVKSKDIIKIFDNIEEDESEYDNLYRKSKKFKYFMKKRKEIIENLIKISRETEKYLFEKSTMEINDPNKYIYDSKIKDLEIKYKDIENQLKGKTLEEFKNLTSNLKILEKKTYENIYNIFMKLFQNSESVINFYIENIKYNPNFENYIEKDEYIKFETYIKKLNKLSLQEYFNNFIETFLFYNLTNDNIKAHDDIYNQFDIYIKQVKNKEFYDDINIVINHHIKYINEIKEYINIYMEIFVDYEILEIENTIYNYKETIKQNEQLIENLRSII